MHRFRFAALCATAFVLVLSTFSAPATAATTYVGTVEHAITQLSVAPEDRTGYVRTLFKHWIDVDGDCQNARQETLIAETLAPMTWTTVSNCTAATGQWYSYFDGQTFLNASQVSIDHMVPLAEAWDSGAISWTAQRRQDFANDLGDSRALNAVGLSVNSSKSDNDPTTWMPALQRCRYFSDWVAVKLRWGLSIDSAELTALNALTVECGSMPLTVEVLYGTPVAPNPDTQAPTAPTGLVVSSTGATSVSLSWVASTDNVAVTGYRITRNAVALATSTTNSATDSGLAASTTYVYGVSAIDAAGNVSAEVTASYTTAAPVGLRISGTTRIVGTTKYADLVWTGATGRTDLWRGTTRLLRNTTVVSTTNTVSRTTTTATYTVCPTGLARTSASCSSVTLTW